VISRTRSPRRTGRVLAGGVAAVVVAGSLGTAGGQVVDPIVFTVDPPVQLTLPGTQVTLTFTVSDLPPCADGDLVTLDSLDFLLTDPSDLSTIDGDFSTTEPSGTYSATLSPDMEALTILFDSAILCENPSGPLPPSTKSVTVDVTLDVPAGVPLGTQLSLRGDARGFNSPTDYFAQRTGFVLVAETPPPPPEGGNGSPGGGAPGGGTTGGSPSGNPSSGSPSGDGAVTGVTQLTRPAAAATPVRGTARFTG
jgi:hypothetical protein